MFALFLFLSQSCCGYGDCNAFRFYHGLSRKETNVKLIFDKSSLFSSNNFQRLLSATWPLYTIDQHLSSLTTETISHHRMLMHGFQEETQWHPSLPLNPLMVQPEDPRTQVSSMGSSFLRRFQSPTIFLKISCDGDFLLPIAVGKYYCLFLLHFVDGTACNSFTDL